jgi:hypothetical protein
MKRICLLLIFLCCTFFIADASQIQEYHRVRQCGTIGSTPVVVLRDFIHDSVPSVLCVDPYSLVTKIVRHDSLHDITNLDGKSMSRLSATPYFKAIADAHTRDSSLQDAGIIHGYYEQPGVNLTVDLCPSQHNLDTVLFTKVVDAFGKEEKPVPVAISITGVWMNRHGNDLGWLKQLVNKGEINVTWINHSFNHRVGKGIPLRANFLLEKGTDIDSEILKTEVLMITNGLTPSVFFRFPGLVSNRMIFDSVISYGLIPVGSDAWLGKKNMSPSKGSIVLVHANGNEPIGVERFLSLIKKQRKEILQKQWLLYDLRESIAKEEEQATH